MGEGFGKPECSAPLASKEALCVYFFLCAPVSFCFWVPLCLSLCWAGVTLRLSAWVRESQGVCRCAGRVCLGVDGCGSV